MADNEEQVKDNLPKEANGAQVAAESTKAKTTKRRKKAKRSVPSGQAHIYASFNNTIITMTDTKGNALTAASAGASGFRGSKKGTAYAAQVAASQAAQTAKSQYGMTKADVYVKGVGLGRDSAIRAIAGADIQVEKLSDVTGVAHGGVRPKKARRV